MWLEAESLVLVEREHRGGMGTRVSLFTYSQTCRCAP